MNQNDLKPAGSFAKQYGVKAILYGQPGTGKTPMINTAPRPVLLSVEPGLRSMAGSNVPTWEARDYSKIDEFFNWFSNSKESANFDTLAIDSGSEIAEIILKRELATNKDGRRAYGEMSRKCMEWFDQLYYMKEKHIVLICKQTKNETGKSMVNNGGIISVEVQYQTAPYFPGNDLNTKVPHRYDEILYASHMHIPNVGATVGLRTKGTPEIHARDRSGQLAEIEPPNLAQLFAKCM